MISIIDDFIQWANANSGFISVLLFVLTMILGWLSGVFRSLLRKPKFRIEVLKQATFGSVFYLKNKNYNGYAMHKTAFAIYLSLTNVGFSPASIGSIKLGYKRDCNWHFFKSRMLWIKETLSKSTFRAPLADDNKKEKFYPFLKHPNEEQNLHPVDTYLNVGQSSNGIVYFEQFESWGNYLPKIVDNKVKVVLIVEDSYGRKYKKKEVVKILPLQEVIDKYNASFAQTHSSIN